MIVETAIDLPRIESRMLRWMTIAAALGVVATLAAGHWMAAMAFGVGAGLGVLNFHWLWLTGKVLMGTDTGRVPVKTIIMVVGRYPLALAGMALLYWSGWVPMVPVISGLLVPSVGVFVESIFLIGADLRHKQTA